MKKTGGEAANLGLKLGFCHFLKFGSSVFLEIAYNDSLQQYLTTSTGKIHEKKFWGPNLSQINQNRVQG